MKLVGLFLSTTLLPLPIILTWPISSSDESYRWLILIKLLPVRSFPINDYPIGLLVWPISLQLINSCFFLNSSNCVLTIHASTGYPSSYSSTAHHPQLASQLVLCLLMSSLLYLLCSRDMGYFTTLSFSLSSHIHLIFPYVFHC